MGGTKRVAEAIKAVTSQPIRDRTVVSTPVQRGQIYRLRVSEQPVPEAGDGQPLSLDTHPIDESEKNKRRPLVVVSRDDLNNGHSVVAVPLYSQQLEKRSRLPYCVPFKSGEFGLNKDSVAKCDEVSVIEKCDLNIKEGPVGRVNAERMALITKAIRYVIRDDSGQ